MNPKTTNTLPWLRAMRADLRDLQARVDEEIMTRERTLRRTETGSEEKIKIEDDYKQHQFVMEYLTDPNRNATQAALRAGYSPSGARQWACRMLKDPEIRQHIDQQLMKHVQQLNVDVELVITGILKAIQDAKDAGVGAWQAATVLRGYELLGRDLGIFKDRVEISQDVEIMERLHQGREYARRFGCGDEDEDKPDDAEKPKPN